MLARSERPIGPISRVVGLYQSLLAEDARALLSRRLLESQGDRSVIDWDGSPDEATFRISDDDDGLGVAIEWLGTRLGFRPESPCRSCRWSGG